MFEPDSNFVVDDDGQVTVKSGSYLNRVLEEGIEVAKRLGQQFEFTCTKVRICVMPDSSPWLLIRDYLLVAGRATTVGPYPELTLPEEVLPEGAMPEVRTRLGTVKFYHVKALLEASPKMKFVSEQAERNWKAHGVPLISSDTYEYAEAWACLMQWSMSQGRSLAQVWKAMARLADVKNVSEDDRADAALLLLGHWVMGAEFYTLYEADRVR